MPPRSALPPSKPLAQSTQPSSPTIAPSPTRAMPPPQNRKHPPRSAPAPIAAPDRNTPPPRTTHQVSTSPAGARAYMENKRAENPTQSRQPVTQSTGLKYRERLPDGFVPSSPTEAMFYTVFGMDIVHEDEVDNLPFLLANRAMPTPKG